MKVLPKFAQTFKSSKNVSGKFLAIKDYGYTTKFTLDLIEVHTDFISALGRWMSYQPEQTKFLLKAMCLLRMIQEALDK